MEGNNQRPKIKYCSICEPFVFILREDDTIGLFIGEPERGKIRRKDMSPMGEKVCHYLRTLFPTLIVSRKTSRYIAGSFFNDTTGIFETRVNENASAGNSDAQLATSTLQVAMTAGQKTQWLMLSRPQGVVEVGTRHVIISITNGYRLCVDLDPPQVNFSVLNYRDCISSESPGRFI